MTVSVPVPRLLVSVRDVAEARRAADGGADIIDFKDPSRGPLGRADFDVVAQAVDALRRRYPARPPRLSLALGEAHEVTQWLGGWNGRLSGEIAWLKLGLSQLGSSPNWVQQWLTTRRGIEQRLSHAAQWVAVAYADAGGASAPPIDAVVEAAAQTGCAGVLIDTFDKSGGRLVDHLDRAELKRTCLEVHRRGLFFAVAGRVNNHDLPGLAAVGADIVGVRSAVCTGSDRQAGVSTRRVTALRRQLHGVSSEHESKAAMSTPMPTTTACRPGD